MLQGEEILSQRSHESEDDEEGAEQRSPLPQDQSEDEVRASLAFCNFHFLLFLAFYKLAVKILRYH